jgi:CheY-like chemotaxis protein
MILLAEENSAIRKVLCDILNRERIIAVESPKEALEALVEHKGEFNVIIGSTRGVRGMISNKIIDRLCKKINIDVPPIIGIYKKGEESLVKKLIEEKNDQKFLKYDEKDADFSAKYIEAIKAQYPDLLIDEKHIKPDRSVRKQKNEIEDIRSWLIRESAGGYEPEGAGSNKDEAIPENDKDVDYKKLYLEVKAKYDELLKYIHELTDTD